MPKLYFLCTGNSCRSQMAEGFARYLANNTWQIQSAGIEAHGLNPLAVKVMAEVGIDISTYRSKQIDNDYLMHADLVVTLCGDARDRCPVTPPSVKRLHWPLPDPAAAVGDEAARLAVFRQVRDEIQRRVQALLN
ncbi:arsenate reductase (thioredoxin) [Lacticaseibacillus jixiensis]|uniref:arsenate reductase (thioredoxin) n=1 Tax=Lacticaseibacillus jixiensis TaxID=3231926 RepID=UPI0036F3AA8E